MSRVSLLLGACLVASLALAPAAGAQETTVRNSAAIAAGAPPLPDYILERNDTVINEGDQVTDCQGLLIGFQKTRERLQDDAQAMADKCREIGVSPDLQTGDSEVVLSLGTGGSPASGAGELPDTGGISLMELAGLGSGIALIGGGLLLRSKS